MGWTNQVKYTTTLCHDQLTSLGTSWAIATFSAVADKRLQTWEEKTLRQAAAKRGITNQNCRVCHAKLQNKWHTTEATCDGNKPRVTQKHPILVFHHCQKETLLAMHKNNLLVLVVVDFYKVRNKAKRISSCLSVNSDCIWKGLHGYNPLRGGKKASDKTGHITTQVHH